ncbi:MAG: trypsin-like peptidase domain-containing protein [Candidatus Marinimicrobia bacterium]|nr:trypsin-like peptidase domain-containing protein [Candidatus Neomarinimicrobiota bacterium]
MTKVKVTDIVKKSLVKIVVIDNKTGKVYSHGSGVIVNESGFILTANHVVSSQVKDKSKSILAIPYIGGGAFSCIYKFGGISLGIQGQKFISPLNIDLAILAPLKPHKVPPISLSQDIPKEGTEVIMAGFSEDLRLPLDLPENIDKSAVGGQENINKIKEFSYSIIPWIMVKHGIIGGVFHIISKNFKTKFFEKQISFSLKAAEYWIDNTYARGASGGPVVDMDGNLLGIITERGETYESDLTQNILFPIPSGTVRVLSHKLITWSLEELTKRWKPPYEK